MVHLHSVFASRKKRVVVEVLLYVDRNRRLIRDREHRTAASTFTQLLSSEKRVVDVLGSRP